MSDKEARIWYYATSINERIGPVSLHEMADRAATGIIRPETLVWSPEYPSWIPAEEISHLLSRELENPASDITREEVAPLPPCDLKPRKGSFLFPRIITGFVVSAVIGGMAAGALAIAESPPWPALAVFAVGAILTMLSALAAYRKERYQLQASRMVCHRGGMFSDEATELDLRNITHVKLKLPWLRYKFFRIGDVIVETAGTAKPMVMRAIHEPETIYAEMRERMKYNGYDLSQRELLHEEKPSLIGIIVECLGLLLGAAFFCMFFLAGFLQDKEISMEGIAAQSVIAFILLGIIIFAILRFLDLRRRTYRVFNDVVVYDEGFLTRHHAFIPYENIADSNTKRTFADQILGLYDVQVSCQGSSGEIKFRRLRNGINLSNAIDRLVSAAGKKPKPGKRHSMEDSVGSVPKRARKPEPDALPATSIRMAEYRIHAVRLFVPLLFLLPVFPLWIVVMLKSLILLASTRYYVRPDSLRHSYKFLRVDEREFSYDKITGIVIKRNLWDKWFDTMTLKFWSLGSGKALEFAHVHRSHVDLPALMRQVGIPEVSEGTCEVEADFGLFTWLRARLGVAAFLGLFTAAIAVTAWQMEEMIYLLLALPILMSIAGLVYAKLYYARQRLRFHEHHVEAEQGVISISTYHVRYKNVKRISATRYPGGEEGCLKIYVAGEEQVYAQQAQAKGGTPMMRQCSFSSGMLPHAGESGRLLDDILSGRVEPCATAIPAERSEVFLESKRSVGTAIAALLLVNVLLFPLIALLPLTIPLTIIRVKRWRYRVEEARVVVSSGVLFRDETSVLLDRVDSLQQSQGPLNKIFRNGKVSIMTAGSSKPDLLIPDTPDYLALYEEIRKRSE